MTDDQLPADHVLEQGMGIGGHFLNADRELNTIDWKQPRSIDEAVQRRLRRHAVQFHYANLSHLILCGRVTAHQLQGATLQLQEVAIVLAPQKLVAADAWSRYLSRVGGGEEIVPSLTQYYRQLFSEEQALDAIIAMETIAIPVSIEVYGLLGESEDPLFADIATSLRRMKQREQDVVTPLLASAIKAGKPDMGHFERIAGRYRARSLAVLAEDKLAGGGTLRDRAAAAIDSFHAALGIPVPSADTEPTD